MALHEDEARARSEILLRDAEDDLARERLHDFWRQWGSTVVGMCLMLVVGTGAGVVWREWREARDAASTVQLAAIVEDPALPMTEDAAQKMTDAHAAIGWLSRAGTVDLGAPASSAQREELAAAYEAAAGKGGDTAWGLLARWNTLRLRMDDASGDPEKLMDDFDDLADRMGDTPLAALPLTDAAVVAGERARDPARALEYLDRAEKAAGNASQMSVHIADLRHLYQIRAADASPAAQTSKENNQ